MRRTEQPKDCKASLLSARALELHKTLFVKPPRHKFAISLDEDIPDQRVFEVIRSKALNSVTVVPDTKNGALQIWSELVDGRLDQSKHYGLGIILNGAFVPIEAHLGARHGIESGDFISGKRFPVIQRRYADCILFEPLTSELPTDCVWDIDTKTILHIRAYYIRYPKELWSIKTQEITRLRLTELFRQTVGKSNGDN